VRKVDTIQIQTEPDIISARMRVRELARSAGFRTTDQARISLATSSLAHAVGLGGKYEGEISIGHPNGDHNKGITVVCFVCCGGKGDGFKSVANHAFRDVQWMVDELNVETTSANDVQITLIKWKA